MLIAIHGVMIFAHCYTWSEAVCSLLHMGKIFGRCFTWSEIICSLLYMECSFMLIPIH